MSENIKPENNKNEENPKEQETKKVNAEKEELKKANTEKEDLKKIKTELEDITDRYKREIAEFENSKKRKQKERENLYNSILSDIIEVMLPILDNLENAAKVETKDEE